MSTEDSRARRPPLARCNECGKGPRKIQRVRFGHRYCSTCYQRVFKHAACPRCGERARLPKNHPDALCIRCERSGPCHRCRREIDEIGRHTRFGPVCKRCVRYYDEAPSCERCGRTSVHVGSYRREGRSTRLCSGCAYPDRRSCHACHRHRDVRQVPDGRLLCRKCDEIGLVDCPECSVPMPAGSGRRCWDCDWRERLAKRIAINRGAFEVPAMAEHFEAFGRWLGDEIGLNKAAMKINRYVAFFMEIEKRWGGVPGYGALAEHFGTGGLRKVLLPTRWMTTTGLIVVDETAKRDWALVHQVTATLERFAKGSRERTVLGGYRDLLMARHANDEISLITVKGQITPAAALLAMSAHLDMALPDQRLLERFLRDTPGQRAALYGFVAHLREHHEADIRMPSLNAQAAAKTRRECLEREVHELLVEKAHDKDFEDRWISLALQLFHGLPLRDARVLMRGATVTRDEDGFYLVHEGLTYYVPSACGTP